MVESRTATALVVGAASLAASALLYAYTDSLLFFLFVPFVPFLFSDRGSESESDTRSALECPRCEFSTRHPDFEYCPHDGSRLRER
jgi:hypothetical protein